MVLESELVSEARILASVVRGIWTWLGVAPLASLVSAGKLSLPVNWVREGRSDVRKGIEVLLRIEGRSPQGEEEERDYCARLNE
jgi:hypothetical protein